MHQPLLLDRPFPVQVLLAIVVPVLLGLLTGYLLGVSEPAYLVASLLGVLGGVAAGYDHVGSGEGLVRGIIGGLLFGVAIVAGHSVFDQQAKAQIPDPQLILAAITTVLGALFGAWGGSLRAKAERRRHAGSAAAA